MKKKEQTARKEKSMHGQIPKEAEKETMNRNETWKLLAHGNFKVETEAVITACEEKAIAINYLKARVIKTDTDSKYRLCRLQHETNHHILWCLILMKKFTGNLTIQLPHICTDMIVPSDTNT